MCLPALDMCTSIVHLNFLKIHVNPLYVYM